jgi:hypothetical protein
LGNIADILLKGILIRACSAAPQVSIFKTIY